MFGTIGVQEMVVIFIVALVLFGPKKLPELGRTLGKALTEFRRASNDLKASFEREMHNLEREAELEKTKAEIKNALPAASEYEYSYQDYGEYSAETYPNTATNSTTVSASESSSAELHGTPTEPPAGQASDSSEAHPEQAAVAAPHVEGTVPRSEPTTRHS
ncbi:MAG TPA: TatA/E family twin arginine-targeting protein translocase [Bryobacteraceae bacterium]|jgi:TatA/E family protein of Tat protein translocase|nr:TatA/E family twin arginine-targeting protein translocase [Bryobacteraceae bacterium]